MDKRLSWSTILKLSSSTPIGQFRYSVSNGRSTLLTACSPIFVWITNTTSQIDCHVEMPQLRPPNRSIYLPISQRKAGDKTLWSVLCGDTPTPIMAAVFPHILSHSFWQQSNVPTDRLVTEKIWPESIVSGRSTTSLTV